MRNLALQTLAQVRNQALQTRTLVRNQALQTPTQVRKQALKTLTQVRSQALQTPTQVRSQALQTPTPAELTPRPSKGTWHSAPEVSLSISLDSVPTPGDTHEGTVLKCQVKTHLGPGAPPELCQVRGSPARSSWLGPGRAGPGKARGAVRGKGPGRLGQGEEGAQVTGRVLG